MQQQGALLRCWVKYDRVLSTRSRNEGLTVKATRRANCRVAVASMVLGDVGKETAALWFGLCGAGVECKDDDGDEKEY